MSRSTKAACKAANGGVVAATMRAAAPVECGTFVNVGTLNAGAFVSREATTAGAASNRVGALAEGAALSVVGRALVDVGAVRVAGAGVSEWAVAACVGSVGVAAHGEGVAAAKVR